MINPTNSVNIIKLVHVNNYSTTFNIQRDQIHLSLYYIFIEKKMHRLIYRNERDLTHEFQSFERNGEMSKQIVRASMIGVLVADVAFVI